MLYATCLKTRRLEQIFKELTKIVAPNKIKYLSNVMCIPDRHTHTQAIIFFILTHFNDDEKQGKEVDNLESCIDTVASATDTTLIPELELHTVNFTIHYNIGLLYDNDFKY